MSILEDECERAGLDRSKLASIVRRLSKAAADAKALGLTLFGGSGSGSLRWRDPYESDYPRGPLIVAHLQGDNFDGGDGAEHPDEHGLMYGEDG